MKTLGSLAELAYELEKGTLGAILSAQHAMHQAAKVVQHDAQERIGQYQAATGPFDAWEELAESTQKDRVNKGYTPDDPLLRDGTLRDSIEVEAAPMEAVIGSKLDIAAYQEFGTATVPPRPFLGPAAFDNTEKIQKLIGKAVVQGLSVGQVVSPLLGYDMTID